MSFIIMTNALHYLKTFRKRTGLALQDMASLIGIDTGNLSKIENGKSESSVRVLLAYHLILKIPIEQLLKNHFSEVIKDSLRNAIALKDRLLNAMTEPNISHQIILIDTIIDRLVALDRSHDS